MLLYRFVAHWLPAAVKGSLAVVIFGLSVAPLLPSEKSAAFVRPSWPSVCAFSCIIWHTTLSSSTSTGRSCRCCRHTFGSGGANGRTGCAGC